LSNIEINITLKPNRHELIKDQLGEGQGTWIYQFRKRNLREGVELEIPEGANPRKKLIWPPWIGS